MVVDSLLLIPYFLYLILFLDYQQRVPKTHRKTTKVSVRKLNLNKTSVQDSNLTHKRNRLGLIKQSTLQTQNTTIECLEIEEDEEAELRNFNTSSPAIRRASHSLHNLKMQRKDNDEMLGYLDTNYNFVVPDFNLQDEPEDNSLTMEGLNFLRALSLVKTESTEREDRQLAIQIIRKILS